MPRKFEVHVYYRPRKETGRAGDYEGWTVQYGRDILFTRKKQRDATAEARDIAKERQCELVIHAKKTGRFREKASFGRDPRGKG